MPTIFWKWGLGLASYLLPYALEIKNKDAKYYATDLSEKMLEVGKKRLQDSLEKYGSKLSFNDWISKNKLILKKANGEMPFELGLKFDRIICNMVLMDTENPEIMLANLYNESSTGCLLGASIWGDPSKNFYHPLMEQLMRENDLEVSKERSLFFLYNNLKQLAEKVGWKTVVYWDQVASLPYLTA